MKEARITSSSTKMYVQTVRGERERGGMLDRLGRTESVGFKALEMPQKDAF